MAECGLARRREAPTGAGPGVFLIVLGLSLASVLGVALLYVRRLTRPLGDLAEAARAAGRGDRTARVAEDGPREMRDAAAAFNDMQGRIARFDAERMRTLAAVGHDLRTPITSLRIRAELLDEADAAPMIRTLDEMTVMANGLVAYARGAGEAEAIESIDLALLLARLCEERGAGLKAEAAIAVMARPVALGRAIGNLIDNAVRYGGAARVRLSRDAGEAVIAIEDDGPGIPPDIWRTYSSPSCAGTIAAARRLGARALACRSRAPSSRRMAGSSCWRTASKGACALSSGCRPPRKFEDILDRVQPFAPPRRTRSSWHKVSSANRGAGSGVSRNDRRACRPFREPAVSSERTRGGLMHRSI